MTQSRTMLLTAYSYCLIPSAYWLVATRQPPDSKRPTKLQVTGYSIRLPPVAVLLAAFCLLYFGGPTRTRTWDQRIMSPLL